MSTTPGLRLAAILTTDPERQSRAREAYPDARLVTTLDAMLDGPGRVDALVVASPNRFHAAQARAALDAGLHVVVDKPLASSAADARALVEAAGTRQLLTVFHNRRWDGDFLTVRALASSGVFGEIRRFESRFERWRPEPRDVWRERGDRADAGGLLFDLGTHLIDQALLLLGPVETVYAELDRRRPGVVVDDDSFVALGHRSGARSHLWCSQTAAHAGPRFRVLGSRAAYVKPGMDAQEEALRAGARPGSAEWGRKVKNQRGELHSGAGGRRVPTEPGNYPRFYTEFASAVLTGSRLPVDPADAVAGLEIIEAAQRSAATQEVVRLEDPAKS